MVQKKTSPVGALPPTPQAPPKPRGRPRAYQPDVALAQALALFRKNGFAATSLDDLAAATGMNRPSLYGAFGDKRALYIRSLERYRAEARAAMVEIFAQDLPVRERLARIYAVALDIYLSGGEGPRGCFSVMTAASDVVQDDEIRAMVVDSLQQTDKVFARAFQMAKARGELPSTTDPQALAQMASGVLHTIAVRARARVPRKELEALVENTIDVLAPLPRRGRRVSEPRKMK